MPEAKEEFLRIVNERLSKAGLPLFEHADELCRVAKNLGRLGQAKGELRRKHRRSA